MYQWFIGHCPMCDGCFDSRNIILEKGCTTFNYKFVEYVNCHHLEATQLICSTNQLTGFYMMATLVWFNATARH